MKFVILLIVAILASTAVHGQSFEIHYDAVTIMHGQSHENSFASGVITLEPSQVKWANGHAEDLLYMGKTQVNHPQLGLYTQYAWSRLEDTGKIYIGLKVIDGKPFQVTVNVYGNVFVSGDKIIRKDSVVFYTDTNKDSFALRQN